MRVASSLTADYGRLQFRSRPGTGYLQQEFLIQIVSAVQSGKMTDLNVFDIEDRQISHVELYVNWRIPQSLSISVEHSRRKLHTHRIYLQREERDI